MTQTFFPFDSGPGANVREDQWREQFKQLLSAGVLAGEGGGLAVTGDSSGMQVKVAAGAAWIQGHYYASNAVETLPIAAADPTNPRIDRVVLRADFVANTILLAVLTGTPAGSPVAPTVTQNATTWEVSLATVAVAAAAVTITAGNVTDGRVYAGLPTNRIQDQAITNAKIADLTIQGGKLQNNAVSSDKIDPAVAGNGLVGGGGSPLAVNPDNSTIEVAGDQLRVKDGGVTAAKIANRTRYMPFVWSPVLIGSATWAEAAYASGPQFPDSGSPQIRAYSHVPADFVSGSTATIRLIYIALATGECLLNSQLTAIFPGVAGWNVDPGTTRSLPVAASDVYYEATWAVADGDLVPGRPLVLLLNRLADANTGNLWLVSITLEYTADM